MHLYYIELVLITYVHTVHTHTHTLQWLQSYKYYRVFFDQLCFLKKKNQPDLQTIAMILSGFDVSGLKHNFTKWKNKSKDLYSPT